MPVAVEPDPGARTRGPGPRVMLVSRPDTASVNIAKRVRERAAWSETRHELDGHRILALEGVADRPVFLAAIDDWHIRRENVGEQLAEALGRPLEAILVLSRHRAASGHPSFTAHPVGNPTGEVIAGGREGAPTPTHPGMLTTAYRSLRRHARDTHLPHSVSFEATHHGPLTAVPLVFIEIGSDDRHWEDPAAGAIVAQAALETVRTAPTDPPASVMAIGGGHYAPRFGPLVEETTACVGHMLAAYHWTEREGIARETLAAFLAASAPPGKDRPDGVYFDHKSLAGPARQQVLADLEALDVPRLRTADLPSS